MLDVGEGMALGPRSFEAPQWTHPGDYEVIKGRDMSVVDPHVPVEGAALCFFDGGAAKQLGTGGTVCYGIDGEWCRGAARWYGADCPTNNTAEVTALCDLMRDLVDQGVPLGASSIVVFGDSRLVVDFANRVAKPGKSQLFLAVREIEKLRRQLRGVRITFRHVLRDKNQVADWLANVARVLGRDWFPERLPLRVGDPPPWKAEEAA